MSRATAGERLQRLLALVPWVAEHDGPTVEEVCARFELKPSELAEELSLLMMVGLPPYTPDALFDAVIDDGRVFVHFLPSFDRALRLTPEQALTLVAAGASLTAVPGADPEGPLARGVAKLAKVLDVDPGSALAIELGRASQDVLARLREAIAAHRRIHLDYYSAGRDAHAERDLDPYRLWSEQGAWYVTGLDHLRGEQRNFRVDRITSLALLDATFTPPAVDPDDDLFTAGESPRVVLDLPASVGWVLETYPLEDVEVGADGRLRVTLAVGGRPWLERLLLGIGPEARVLESPDDPSLLTCGRDAAALIRSRYR